MRIAIVIAVLVVVLAGAVFVWLRARALPGTTRGMKQFAQNPDMMRAMAEGFAARDQLLARAETLSDDELRAGIEALLSGDRSAQENWQRVLEKVGRRAEPLLVRALDDPRCDASRVSEVLGPDTPFMTVTRTLAHIGSVAVIARLLPWTESDEKRKREHACLCIAHVGAPESVDPTRGALGSARESDRTYAIMGVCWAVESNNVTPQFREAVFEALAPFAAGEVAFATFGDRDASRAIMQLDPDRAATLFLSARCLRPDNRFLAQVLAELNQKGAPIPESALQPLLSRAKAEAKYPWTYVHAECLTALARMNAENARREIDDALRSGEDRVRAGAIGALRTLLKLPDPYALCGLERVSDRPAPVRHVIAALAFQAEVNNGGVSQYFFNSAGDDWATAMESFRAMGAVRCADILDRAVKFLGKSGSSSDRDTRIAAYAKLSDDKEKFLDDLSSEFFEDEDLLDLKIVRYMADHENLFRSIELPKE